MPKVTEEYKDSRRQQIMDAAYRCFARKGFHQATMRDIYEEAGLSPGAVYHYFNSKDEIIEASFTFDYQRSLPAFERAAQEDDPIAAIDHLLEYFFAGLESAAALGAERVNIQGWGEALTNPALQAPLRQWLLEIQKLFAGLIRRAQAGGKIDPGIDPQGAAEVLVASYLGVYLQKAFLPEMDVRRYQSALQALLRGAFILAG